MTTTKNILKIEFGFENSSETRTVELGPFSNGSSALTNAKSRIKALKNNINAISGIYLDSDGNSCTSIVNAYKVETTDEAIDFKEE